MLKLGQAGITARLCVGFGFILILMGVLSWSSIVSVNRIDGDLNQINMVNSRLQRYAINFRGSVHDRAIAIRDVVLIDNASQRQETIGLIDRLAASYAENEKAMGALMATLNASSDERRILADIAAVQSDTNPLVADIIKLQSSGSTEAARKILLSQASGRFKDWLKAINQFIDFEEAANTRVGAEVSATSSGFQTVALAILGGALVLAIGVALLVARSITVPIRRIQKTIHAMSDGNLTISIPCIDRRDEIGSIANALNSLRGQLKEADVERVRQRAVEVEASQVAEQRRQLSDGFVARMEQHALGFAKASSEVADAAKNLSATAEETSRQARAVSGAAEEASTNVQTVAASTEEMTASIREIAGQVLRSNEIANTAALEAARTEANVKALSEAATKIGEVVDLINNIAGQTNLLALNATIEAARAGESGRGFAVVASEVKQLAAQTARATEEISSKISEIQSATDLTVGSINRIVGTVAQIQQISTMIASAIEEQGAATGEISSNTQLAARGTENVTNNISGVSVAAGLTGSASTQLMGLSNTLNGQASELQHEVADFVQQLRTA